VELPRHAALWFRHRQQRLRAAVVGARSNDPADRVDLGRESSSERATRARNTITPTPTTAETQDAPSDIG
jgi:hypothetical protein